MPVLLGRRLGDCSMNRRYDWQSRLDTLLGLAAYGFVGGVAFLLALWLLGAVIVGTVVLAERIAEAIQ